MTDKSKICANALMQMCVWEGVYVLSCGHRQLGCGK